MFTQQLKILVLGSEVMTKVAVEGSVVPNI